jgi:hypothetical protein
MSLEKRASAIKEIRTGLATQDGNSNSHNSIQRACGSIFEQ